MKRGRGPRPTKLPTDLRATKIDIQVEPADLDGNSVVDGLKLVVIPLNQKGEFVPTIGHLTVKMMDEEEPDTELRWFEPWEVEPGATKQLMRIEDPQPGIHLDMPFRERPKHANLYVFVRLKTSDGQSLEAKQSLTAQSKTAQSNNHVARGNWAPRPQTAALPTPWHPRRVWPSNLSDRVRRLKARRWKSIANGLLALWK